MLSPKNVFVLTESVLWSDGFCTPRFLVYFFFILFIDEINILIEFALFRHFLVFWSNFDGGRLLERGV